MDVARMESQYCWMERGTHERYYKWSIRKDIPDGHNQKPTAKVVGSYNDWRLAPGNCSRERNGWEKIRGILKMMSLDCVMEEGQRKLKERVGQT